MMLAMLQPWQPTWLMGPGDGYMRRPFLRRRLKMSSDHPLRLSLYLPLEPRSQCKNIRRRRPTLDDLVNPIPSLKPFVDPPNNLKSLRINSSEFVRSRISRALSIRNICKNYSSNIIGNALLHPLRWQRNNTVNEVRAEMQLPSNLRNLEDLNVELDEATRIITLKARHVVHPDNCRVLNWEYSQRLDDSVDLSHLQVSVNICKGKLEITAPLQAINPSDKATSHTVKTGPEIVDRKKVVHSEEEQSPQSDVQMTTSHAVKTGIETIDKKKVVQSEERQSPQSDVETTKENKSGMEDATITEKGEQDQAKRNGASRERAMEIEDIGVDEESDRISISSIGTYSVNC